MCDGSHVEAGMHSMLPDDQRGSCDTVRGGGDTQEDKKFLAVVMSIRNFTRGIISNLVETEILGGWNYLVGKKERKAIRYFINVQLSH